MTTRSVPRLVSGCVLAVALLATPAMAADYGEPVYGRGDGVTKDGYPVPVGPDEGGPPPANYHQSYKDDGGPPPPPSAPPPRRRVVAECLSKYGIREALNGQGWHEFANVEMRGNYAYMIARNDRGRSFDLTIDSCNGDVLDARPRVVYSEGPVYYERYYAPRPAVGFYFGPGGYRHHRW